MKGIFKAVALGASSLVLVFILAAGTGLVDLQFYRYFGKERANIQREIFKENKSYVEGMVSDLAKFKYEYTTEENEVAQKAIADLIRTKFANFDLSNIEDASLRKFLVDIRGGY